MSTTPFLQIAIAMLGFALVTVTGHDKAAMKDMTDMDQTPVGDRNSLPDPIEPHIVRWIPACSFHPHTLAGYVLPNTKLLG